MNVKSSRSYHHARFQRPCSQSIPENTDAKRMFFCLFFLFFLKHETHQLSPLTFYSMISMCVVLKNKQQTNKNILLLSDEKFFKKTKNTNNIHINNYFKKNTYISMTLFRLAFSHIKWKKARAQTIVRKIPNSGFISTRSPSVKMNCFLRSFLQASTMAICCAATDRTGRSIRLNSSKQPHDPDWAKPVASVREEKKRHKYRCNATASSFGS